MDSQVTLRQVEEAPPGGRVVSIGVFDGVHLGHQKIVSAAVREASSRGALSTGVTFSPHPDEVLRPGYGPGALTLSERRTELLHALGVEEVVIVQFDEEFARLAPEEFCSRVLSAHLGARAVFVGENFRFGRGGRGAAGDLSAFGASHGFSVCPVGLFAVDGEAVSSTRIRTLLREGKVSQAAKLLGRPHRLEGLVVRGVGRGRELGVPTANLLVEGGLLIPEDGVYVTRTAVDRSGEWIKSVTSVGSNPTFPGEDKVVVESHLLRFEGDLYESTLAVEFLERLRPQVAFADSQALRVQIRDDVEQALEVHGRRSGESQH